MQAVILAAGLGSRLGDLKGDLPKGFLYLDVLQERLIERSLRLLKLSGIKRVLIGTGYKSEAYDELARELSDSTFQITTHKNEHFATTGSATTLWYMRENITQDFLLLESDLLYEPRALQKLLDDERKDIVLGSSATNSGDEVFLSIKENRLYDLSKKRSELCSVDSELVGITKISYERFRGLDCLSEHDYEYLLRGFFVLSVHDLIWCEIDCLEHLERAKQLIIPRLLQK